MNQVETLTDAKQSPVWISLQRAWMNAKQWLGSRPKKKLRLVESLSLGERRFLAVIDFSGRKFLIGGGSSEVKLLTELTNARNAEQNEEA